MRFRQPQPERNTGPHLTIPVKTRSPLEAMQLLKQGNPVDVMGGYFEQEGYVGDDFFMLDKIAKLHKLAELRQLEAAAKADIKEASDVINSHNQKVQDEIRKQKNSQVTQGQQAQSTSQQPVGPVS